MTPVWAHLPTSTTLVLALVAVACGGGNDTKESTPGATTQGTSGRSFTDEEARAAAQALLLTLEDLPTGWREQPADTDPTPPPPSLQGECAGLVEEEGAEPGEVVELQSSEFASPEEEVEAQFTAEVFEQEAGAVNSFADARRLAGECRGQFEDAFAQAVRDELARDTPAPGETPLDVEVTSVELTEMQFGGFGDDSAALRISTFFRVRGQEAATYFDLIGVRAGNVIGGFSYHTNGDPPDAAAEQEFAARVEQRTRAAAESLK